MTEVEFTHLVSELTQSAKTLNQESDSINALISKFEETLTAINLGLEVWLTYPSLRSGRWTEENDEGVTTDEGTQDEELGFTKVADKWRLAVRTATYRIERGTSGLTLLSTERPWPLLDQSREIRIEALRHFPALAARMKQAADAAVKAITDAKKFVK
jgi:hypothetical protein